MINRFVVAIGAGCAAAFLFAVSAQTSPLAMALAYLAPLPVMIATMGWGFDAGAAAAVISAAGLTLLAEPLTGLLYAASVAAPAWMLAAFAVAPVARYFSAKRPSTPPHPSPGAIVVFAAAIGMLGAAAVLTAIMVLYHGYAEGAKQAAAALEALTAEAFDPNDGSQAQQFAAAIVHYGPAAIAASTLLMLSVNLYVAARSTQLSHRLHRSWPDLPTSLRLPWPLGALAIVCAACAFVLPPPASQYFWIGVGGLGGAFVLQGLAVAHALSRGLKARFVMLIALYACCLLRAKYTLPVLAALGVIDAFTKLRARAVFLPSPRPTSQR